MINTRSNSSFVLRLSFSVSSAQVRSVFFSLHVIIGSIKKPCPLSQIILLSAQPLCKVSYSYHNSYASLCHLHLSQCFPRKISTPHSSTAEWRILLEKEIG